MASEIKKAKVTLDGVPLAATQGIAWAFVAGTAPYSTTFTVHKTAWQQRLRGQKGKPLVLEITDSRGVKTTVRDVYILHEAPSDSPHRAAFVVADRRWKWVYKLVARDFNMPRKTGDRTAFQSVPVELQTVVDRYDYLPYSLDGAQQDKRWTPRRAVEAILELLEPKDKGGKWKVESFPIADTTGKGDAGEFTLQGVTLRDAGDVALARMLSYIPGADVYVDAEGRAVIFDATDLDAVEAHFRGLPPSTYTGEAAAWIDRAKIRPSKVIVHYVREIECLFEFEDDYRQQTSASPVRAAPYIENVIPTVDPETTLTEYDPETNQTKEKKVPPGTWVRVDKWLEAMDDDRPEGSLPWTFDTIQRHWLKGDLDGVLGARGLDLDETANVALRVQALRAHFRQTFRINRRYMERVRDLRAVRVALLDPVTGARAPAAVWGQGCNVPSTKGKLMAARGTEDVDKLKVFRNVDYLAPSRNGSTPVAKTAPGPVSVDILDNELGIFHLQWLSSPYGDIESWIPCHLVGEGDQSVPTSITRDLAQQDDKPMGAGMKVAEGTNGIFLRPTMECVVMLTIIPCSPNDATQFHRMEVEAEDVQSVFRREFRIAGGDGPSLEVFVPPGEATARFAWADDVEAHSAVQRLLGLVDGTGIEGPEIPGFTLCNEQRHLSNHAISVAAELLANYADNVQGAVVTRVPEAGAKLVGNMTSTIVRVASAPSGKVDAVHQFPGQQRQISRLAVMPEATRHIILGIVPFKA